jgi:DNA mismatch endonuclease, patch repair protein
MERILRNKLFTGKFRNVSKVRSYTMSRIRSKGNKTTESKFRLVLVRAGIRGWKVQVQDVFGAPDFYFSREKIAVFVDGCFWHGCTKCGHLPKTRSAFWKTKFERNRKRSRDVKRVLRQQRIRVYRIWEHELLNPAMTLIRIKQLLNCKQRE